MKKTHVQFTKDQYETVRGELCVQVTHQVIDIKKKCGAGKWQGSHAKKMGKIKFGIMSKQHANHHNIKKNHANASKTFIYKSVRGVWLTSSLCIYRY